MVSWLLFESKQPLTGARTSNNIPFSYISWTVLAQNKRPKSAIDVSSINLIKKQMNTGKAWCSVATSSLQEGTRLNQLSNADRSSERRIRPMRFVFVGFDGWFFEGGHVLQDQTYRKADEVSQQRKRSCGLSSCKSDLDACWALFASHGRGSQKYSTRVSTGDCIFLVLSPEVQTEVFSCKTT